MKVNRFPVMLFGPETAAEHRVTVPEGSRFLEIHVFDDGLYAYYEIPELQVSNFQTDTFIMPGPQDSVPDNCTFVGITSVIVETPQGQGTMVFVIYKKL